MLQIIVLELNCSTTPQKTQTQNKQTIKMLKKINKHKHKTSKLLCQTFHDNDKNASLLK